MVEFNLLEEVGLPQLKERKREKQITEETKKIARKLDFNYYDGDRTIGFGGYYYDGRWRKFAEIIKKRYNLDENSKVLIERDEKGFITHDLKKLIPGITVYGTHSSDYVINHVMDGYGRWALINNVESGDAKIIEQKAKEEISGFLLKADNLNLPFKDNYFDTVVSINSICCHLEKECREALREIIRVSKNNGKNCYIHVDSWKNQEQKQALIDWTVLCQTLLDENEWKNMFEQEGYEGDWGFIRITKENVDEKGVVIFGASGLIGRYLFDFLKQQGREVIGTYNKNMKEGLVNFDFATDSIDKLDLKNIKYAVICSAIAKIDDCKENYDYAYAVNVEKTKKLIEDLCKKNIVVIFLSTAEVFDGTGGEKEEDLKNPINTYGKQKKQIEDFLISNIRDYLIIRPGKVYGIEIGEGGLFADWLEKYRGNQEIPCLDEGQMAPIYVEDVAKAIFLLINKNARGIYNLSGPKNYTRFELANMFFNYLGIRDAKVTKCSIEDLNLLEPRAKNPWLDISKFIKETNFEFTSLEKIYDLIKERYF